MDKVGRARQLHIGVDSYTSFHIRLYLGKLLFCSRWYGTYDRPDWDFFFQVTEKEADDIVNAGLADWWWTRADVIDKWKQMNKETN